MTLLSVYMTLLSVYRALPVQRIDVARHMLQVVAGCCRILQQLQCVAVCYSVLQCAAGCCRM